MRLHPRSSSFYTDFSALATAKVVLSLKEYDDDLANITSLAPTPPSSSSSSSSPSSQAVLPVDRNQLQLVSLLGKGQFSNVFLVTGSLLPPMIQTTIDEEKEDCNVESSCSIRTRRVAVRKKMLYAYKSIDATRVTDTDELIVAAKDLATEAFILSELDHENVAKLRGLCSERFSKSFGGDNIFDTVTGKSGRFHHCPIPAPPSASVDRNSSNSKNSNEECLNGYFLVLDVLMETLSQRLYRWRKNENKILKNSKKKARRNIIRCIFRATKDTEEADYEKRCRMYERIENVAVGIARGMEYISSKGIVLRDLKPGNVGFDNNDDHRKSSSSSSSSSVKLFDFGMARKVEDCDPNEICGSPRYMAPESMSGKGYTLKVDVYSFGILLYELCSLNVPFAGMLNRRNKKGKNDTAKKKSLSSSSLLSKIIVRPKSSNSSDVIKSNNKINTNNNNDDDDDDDKSNSNDETTQTTIVDHQQATTRTTEEFYRMVVQDESRPSDYIDFVSTVPCLKVRTLIEDCWQSDPTKRPSFQQIVPRINDILFN